MRFVADEGVDAQIVRALRENKHDVLYIAESNAGESDDVILGFANKDNRILITRDKDFGELVFREKMIHSGIILNRLYELKAEEKAVLVVTVIEKYGEQLAASFTVIQPTKIRIRKIA